MTVLDDIVAHLAAQIPARTVYKGAAPGGTLPTRYLVVRTNEGDESASRLDDVADTVAPVVWVTSVSRNGDPQAAYAEAAWGASKARAALRDWRPSATAWKVRPEISQAPIRDEALPDTTFYAVEQFTAQHQI